MKNIIFADGFVGLEICDWLFKYYHDDIGLVVVVNENGIKKLATEADIPVVVSKDEVKLFSTIEDYDFDWGLLIWWPKIISDLLINSTINGFINTHPSFLPYNRGKHFNFWTLVEQSPFGVSLHMVEKGIDSGDIVAQSPILYDWEDTGETLYRRSMDEMIVLFKETYPSLRNKKLQNIKQDLSIGSFHYANEIDAASCIDINKTYLARDLLNLIRARTFKSHPACYFIEDDGEEFEVRIEIMRRLK